MNDTPQSIKRDVGVAKRETEEKIRGLLEEFFKETGLGVYGVHVFYSTASEQGAQNSQVFPQVSLKPDP